MTRGVTCEPICAILVMDEANPVARIQKRLKGYPDVRYDAGTDHIRVFPSDPQGFEVALLVSRGGLTVYYEGWHEEFADEEKALNCFAFGLSDRARLKVLSRGNFDYHWTLESKQGDRWLPDSATGLLFFPFWRRKSVRYLQNRLIRDAVQRHETLP